MTSKRGWGEGSITERGENVWLVRYRVGDKRFNVTVKGTKLEARTKLRELLRSGDTGEHVAPDKISLGEWIETWLSVGAPGKKGKRAGRRTLERYAQLLRRHVVPAIGAKRLQQLQPTDIDRLYEGLNGIARRTRHHVHVVLGACLGAAVRKGLLSANPIERSEKIPSPGESDHGQVLDKDQLAALVQSFKGYALYPIVAVAAFTGARRNEILALRWSDLDPSKKSLRIERALEETRIVKGTPTRKLKGPKRDRHKRTITIDDALIALLLSERDKHLRLVAGVPDGVAVDLSLINLPTDALMFPSFTGRSLDFTRLRDANAVTRGFEQIARKQFPKLRFHDLRGSHETMLLDAGHSVHTVADRCGHDPAELLRSYAKRTQKADAAAAATTGQLLGGVLKD
jgi:integrase